MKIVRDYICFFTFIAFSVLSISGPCLGNDDQETNIVAASKPIKAIELPLSHTQLEKKIVPLFLSAIFDKIIFSPPETIITVMQSSTSQHTKHNFFNRASTFYQNEGARAFYRGAFWPFITAAPTRIIVFGSYYFSQYQLDDVRPSVKYGASAIAASTFRSIITFPIDLVRTRRICKIDTPYNIKGTSRSFYPMLVRDLLTFAPTVGGTDYFFNQFPERKSPLAYLSVVSMLSFTTQIIGTPLDALKTRSMENQNLPLTKQVISLWQSRDIIYKTFWPRVLRNSTSVTISLGILHTLITLLD